MLPLNTSTSRTENVNENGKMFSCAFGGKVATRSRKPCSRYERRGRVRRGCLDHVNNNEENLMGNWLQKTGKTSICPDKRTETCCIAAKEMQSRSEMGWLS